MSLLWSQLKPVCGSQCIVICLLIVTSIVSHKTELVDQYWYKRSHFVFQQLVAQQDGIYIPPPRKQRNIIQQCASSPAACVLLCLYFETFPN